MRSLAHTSGPDHNRGALSKLFQVLAVAIVVLFLSVATAFGEVSTPNTQGATVSEKEQSIEKVEQEASDESETVTMTIDLEDGGVIDLEMARGDVVIDTWDGDEILLIVERSPKSNTGSGKSPINVKVSRHGKNVRISALDQLGRQLTDVDLSYRIMMPRSTAGKGNRISQVYDLSKLTSLVFKALQREAVKWLLR
ncbi:MAG: hypothetical protein OEN01_02980 [Candidatus Krumholzibacteria bacterium]|nr:hypothetical protein [Candidatus Krumholzibacteria bacterium]